MTQLTSESTLIRKITHTEAIFQSSNINLKLTYIYKLQELLARDLAGFRLR